MNMKWRWMTSIYNMVDSRQLILKPCCVNTSLRLKVPYDAKTPVWKFWMPIQSRCWQTSSWATILNSPERCNFFLLYILTTHFSTVDMTSWLSHCQQLAGRHTQGAFFFQCAIHTKSLLTLKKTDFQNTLVQEKLINGIKFPSWTSYLLRLCIPYICLPVKL